MTLDSAALPLHFHPRSQAGCKLQGSPASWGEPKRSRTRREMRGPALCGYDPSEPQRCPPCSRPVWCLLRTHRLHDQGPPLPGPIPRPFPECQQQFPGRPGDSSLSQPRGNPMPWCQQRVSPGVWGMGLRLCRAELPEGVGEPPAPAPHSCPVLSTLGGGRGALSPCAPGPWQRCLFPASQPGQSWKTSPTSRRQGLLLPGQVRPPPGA